MVVNPYEPPAYRPDPTKSPMPPKPQSSAPVSKREVVELLRENTAVYQTMIDELRRAQRQRTVFFAIETVILTAAIVLMWLPRLADVVDWLSAFY